MKFENTAFDEEFDRNAYLESFLADLQSAIEDEDWDVAIDFAQNLLATAIVLKEEKEEEVAAA
ncbi:hypothetical protein ACQKPX_10465 [Photobacterium sp. DNB23_23_1]|uniref:Uncharacterized protein n=1 Tax=Photobacterium pectinilyticum TaxID=2906793 RepID=A0ABT1MWT0_9GAMM|nr:hypothetical protein [Photobacterium sp. ZSDE20]MCQ1056941.1 hypothetical protein [Photobacterium sp. ZSDE20]MDD1821076.1 hypothetical protein [Photobacterium sp. ZSDE20]